ncbi:hypothetical protein ACIBXA_10460 [Micromonospora echinaurantiaca]|uniref:hypothetical protein n=1 Tax=Micromonospora echinaurantiaca TaxID=47857 RepID=UPI0037BA5929
MSVETILIRYRVRPEHLSELPGPLPSLESFRRYRAGLEDRCEERATFDFTVVGSYGFGE